MGFLKPRPATVPQAEIRRDGDLFLVELVADLRDVLATVITYLGPTSVMPEAADMSISPNVRSGVPPSAKVSENGSSVGLDQVQYLNSADLV